jgi:hypothetical protein
MTPEDFIIKVMEEKASEWLEMTDDPDALLLRIMAKKITQLMEYIEYLEKRLQHDSSIK